MPALKGIEPTTALLFRVDLIQTLRDIRDLDIPVLAPVAGALPMTYEDRRISEIGRRRTSSLVSL